MPIANVRGANINYEVLGTSGPWVALSPGGRRPLEGVKHLAERVASAGFRVLIHDRRNCGASDLVLVLWRRLPPEAVAISGARALAERFLATADLS